MIVNAYRGLIQLTDARLNVSNLVSSRRVYRPSLFCLPVFLSKPSRLVTKFVVGEGRLRVLSLSRWDYPQPPQAGISASEPGWEKDIAAKRLGPRTATTQLPQSP